MLILAALVLVLVLVGASAMGSATRGEGRWLVVLIGVVGGTIVLVAVVALVGLGLRGGDDEGSTSEPPVSETGAVTTTSLPTSTTTDAEALRPETKGPRERPADLVLRTPAGGGLPSPAPVLGRLADGDTVLVAVEGLDGFERGSIRQCAIAGGDEVCDPALPLQAGGDGRAVMLVELAAELSASRTADCRAQGTECRLDVALPGVPDARLVFGRSAPALPTVEVRPASALLPGDTVAVTVHGLGAGETVVVTQCAAAVARADVCGDPAPEVRAVADASGKATVAYRLTGRDIGGEVTGRCGRDTACGVTVLGTDGTVRSRAVPLTFTTGGTADYDGVRLLGGLVVAVVLGLLALWLIRSTDWTPVGLPSTTDDAPDPF